MERNIKYKKSIRGGQWIPRTDYPITPDHIDFGRIDNVFGESETESACRTIVKGCQQRGEGWAPFTLESMNLQANYPGFVDLLERELVKGWEGRAGIGQDDTFLVSHDFIALLFCNAPSCNAVSTSGHGD